MKKLIFFILVISAVLSSGCKKDSEPVEPAAATGAETASTTGEYVSVSAEEAMSIMREQKDCIILDVRTIEEYAAGHIPGALLIPNEVIGTEELPQLPDKDQVILVYCRSGNRSKQASQKLADLGYTNVIEFGGITAWPYETETSG